jgi:hypothetical protein
MSNFANGLFPGHLAFVMLLPFVMLGLGLWFICRAMTDKVDARSDPRIAVLPDRKNLPLYHVHLQIRASARPRPSPQSEKSERGSSGRPRGRRHHGTRLVVRQ